ncbi:D-alanyl-D-alanine carboxypeptidase family protein [Sabulicella rubraurantiaca]|uniref:D-alanyl-D-alanine carboxypeptidase family protein n=1 Tax=Sabulicella rubraurantiaca TaxID=2811429 RepID=UPI001A9751A0|nr:D-alanyl-D-alanine carboxypeptidase family protein [Sabulicella rubraurantiaca]
MSTAGPAYPGVQLRVSTPPLIGEAVLAVQLRLGELGLACADLRSANLTRNRANVRVGDIAGVFGRRTAAAATDFQRSRGLRQDGIVGERTWSALFAPQGVGAPAATVAPTPRATDRMVVNPDARDVDLAKLHPEMRQRLAKLQEALHAQSVPMRVFEAFRAPERQQHLYAKGRDAQGRIVGRVVTHAKPFESYHQYGLAVDMVIDMPGVNPWEDRTPEAARWWQAFHDLARDQGLEPLSFEKPHIQLAGLSTRTLLAGGYPDGGDESWADNLSQAIARWPGGTKPPPPHRLERPPLAPLAKPADPSSQEESALDWRKLPSIEECDWSHPFQGRPWRVDRHGIYLRDLEGGQRAIRSAGNPTTCGAVIAAFGPQIAKYSAKHGVPPELIVMTIATEVGVYRSVGFTGPRTFRWEAHISDYSAGPMQMLASTARDVNRKERLGYEDSDFPSFDAKPEPPPQDLPIYKPDIAIDLGAAFIRRGMAKTGTNPILVAAAYNAGSVRQGTGNPWGLHCHGDHLDRAAEWFGDACALLAAAGR